MALAASPSSPPKLSPAKEAATIRALRAVHNDALAAFDVDGVVLLSTEDCVVILGGGTKPIHGKAAYRAFVAAAFRDPSPMRFARTPDRIDVGAPDGVATAAETGRWVGLATDGSGVRIAGRYLVQWRQTRGDWQIASETYVTVE